MRDLRFWIILTFLFGIAHQIGYRQGLQGCPEAASAAAETERTIQAELQYAFAEPSRREVACDAAFDLMREELAREELADQQSQQIEADPSR